MFLQAALSLGRLSVFYLKERSQFSILDKCYIVPWDKVTFALQGPTFKQVNDIIAVHGYSEYTHLEAILWN
jgi:hypothetical protein